jgi:D-alanyl-D-alanine carboxypeptidase (penicillin-binding protein 5/6)
MKKIICFFVAVFMTFSGITAVAEGDDALNINAKAAILMEASTGRVLYEQSPDEQLPIASVTKIMTMLLIMEQIDDGKLALDDMITVSENAMSYGGSTMFLETGEQLSVNDMLKGIAVASANDGCVAMAEHIAGSEDAFVEMMNEKAAELGMTNTHFMNTNGLDEDNHYSSARDVAIMSRELIKHEKIFDYTTIWTDELRDGKFQLANTNKLIRFYNGANGLKTGSTSQALCCLSATAKRDDMQIIGVILGAPTSAERFDSAKTLLDYGFAHYSIKKLVGIGDEFEAAPLKKGVVDNVGVVSGDECSILLEKGKDGEIEQEILIDENLTAPIEKGQEIGSVKFKLNDEVVGEAKLVAEFAVEKKGIGSIILDFFKAIMGGENKTL